VVEVHHWLTPQKFASLFTVAQAAPGPNMLVVTLICWRVATLPGALITMLGVAGPSSVLTFVGYNLWYRFRDAAWRRRVQAAWCR
jgi:chromate transporter